MEITLLNVLLFNLSELVSSGILFYIFTRLALLRKMGFFKLFSLFFLFQLPCSVFSGWLYASGLTLKYQFEITLCMEFLSYLTLIVFFHTLFQLNLRKSTVYVVSFHFVTTSTMYLASIMLSRPYNMTVTSDFLQYTFLTFFAAPLLSIVMFWLMGRIRFSYLLNIISRQWTIFQKEIN